MPAWLEIELLKAFSCIARRLGQEFVSTGLCGEDTLHSLSKEVLGGEYGSLNGNGSHCDSAVYG
jgi:hypothetical protein